MSLNPLLPCRWERGPCGPKSWKESVPLTGCRFWDSGPDPLLALMIQVWYSQP